jgi:glycosyltransferase involved in cell wall biosynthesis
MISVCMAVYNGEKYLQEQIESILKQLSPEDELVLSDDASTDASIEIIERIKDSRLILLKNEKRLGPIYNFERALVHCRGDLIFLSDQDDLWLTGKVNACVQKLKEYDLILHDAFVQVHWMEIN